MTIDPDRVTVLGLVIVGATAAYLVCCRKRSVPFPQTVDVSRFALNVGGAAASVWMLFEAIFNVGKPPTHWRAYVIAVAIGLAYHLTRECIRAWPRKLPVPPGEPPPGN